MLLFVAFLLGLSIGSFANAWSFRYDTGRSIVTPSACMACRRHLRWFELVPVLSFVFLRGRCDTCRAPISFQYPLVELIAGAMFVAIAAKYVAALEYAPALIAAIFWSIALALSVYDFRTKIIPNGGVYTLALVALAAYPEHFIAGPLLALPLAAFWYFSGGKWMGFGDAKLELGLGWFLGLSLGLSGLLVAFWLGAFVGVLLIIVSRIMNRYSFSLKTELPFGPFLAIGAFLAWFFQFDMMWLL